MRERAAIDVFQLAAHGNAVCDAARADIAPRGELAQEMRGGLAFDCGIGGEDQLLDLAFLQQPFELAYPELLRTDAIERRKMAHQHEVESAVATRLLDGNDVCGRLDDAQQRFVALRRGANGAKLPFRQHAAAAAANHGLERFAQCAGQYTRARPAFLQQMESHALGSLWPDARQGAQGVDQLSEFGRVLHGVRCTKTVVSYPAATALPSSARTSSPVRGLLFFARRHWWRRR